VSLVLSGVAEAVWAVPLRRAGSATSSPSLAKVGPRVLLPLGALVLVLWLTRWPVAALAAALFAVWLPSQFVGRGDAAAAELEDLASFVEGLRDMLSAGSGANDALARAASCGPRFAYFARCATDKRVLVDGMSIRGSELHRYLSLLRICIALIREGKAGSPAGVLSRLSESIRKRAAFERQMQATLEGPRSSVRFITAFTAGFSLFLVLLSRSYMSAYSTLAGQGVLAVVIALYAGGILVLKRMIAALAERGR
jgi:Flp pilus assembly protein TadB